MELLECVLTHLVLPTKIPNHNDPDPEATSTAILVRLKSACRVMAQKSEDDWYSVQRCVDSCKGIGGRDFQAQDLLEDWKDLRPDDMCLLRLPEQNAALLIRRQVDNDQDVVVFEVFETSPSAKFVLESENAIEWDFPGRAAQVPLRVFQQTSFQENLARFLEQAAQETLHRFAARAQKAGASPVESRDTADPGLLTQFLMPVLEAVGQNIETWKLSKRVRDDVNIYKADAPWRRDPSWLALRVAVQRQLCLIMGKEHGRASYKFLICVLLAQLLENSGQLPAGKALVLKAKLCRRLAKLEQEKSIASRSALVVYQKPFATAGLYCEEKIRQASDQIEKAWETFKMSTIRRIPPLPLRADETSLRLSLPKSSEYLRNLLLCATNKPVKDKSLNLSLPGLKETAVHRPRELASSFFKLAELESSEKNESILTAAKTDMESQSRCFEIAGSISSLLTVEELKHNISRPDQISLFILKVFELWIEMDEYAVAVCPLLGDFHPLFPAESLDVLQLADLSAMHRLQNVQVYLKKRRDNCKYPHHHIFCKPDLDSFAARYVREDANGQSMRQLLDTIDQDSTASRQRKILEWKQACKSYDSLSNEISAEECVCTFEFNGLRNVKGCRKCYCLRKRKRMTIGCHEDFLPSNAAQREATVFELAMPLYLQAYRKATWGIIKKLGHLGASSTPSSPRAEMLLKSYSQLKPYIKTAPQGISMASSKKSFLQTHYREQRMKADQKSVVLPCGLMFDYYDEASKSWVGNLKDAVTFQHLCGFQIPWALLNASVPNPMKPGWISGPTSYETVASQTRCPSQMSVHEFMALQTLLSGTHSRWLTILSELGSSNLNFSDEETTHLVGQLAIQAGPSQTTSDVLRDAHVTFRDDLFCNRLWEQIEKRLRVIEANWREVHGMELLLTLALRLHSLTTGEMRQKAYVLIQTVRQATLQWGKDLGDKFRGANDGEEAARVATYRFQAALLCRRTFAVFADGEQKTMSADELRTFISASISLQQSIVVDPAKLAPGLGRMLMRDLKTAHRLRPVLYEAVTKNSDTLGPAFEVTGASGYRTQSCQHFRPWSFLKAPYDSWMVSVMTSDTVHGAAPQVFHYDIVEGHLLIDRQPMGRPPLDIMESEPVKHLFGDRHFQTYPSPLAGMTHALVNKVHDHEIHFGRRGNETVVRAIHRDKYGKAALYEYIPPKVFVANLSYDLPTELLHGCAHWLDLRSGYLEIRREPKIWKHRTGNWILNVRSGQAKRRESYLVDPHSDICRQINRILEGFEKPQNMTVFQPTSKKGKLSVELKALELSFFVNKKRLLQCRQLQAEVDPNQDAGTFYGLENKIVLRDVLDGQQRSIIVGLGSLNYERRGMHVSVRVKDTQSYAKFEIDDVLRRLTCPPHPRHLYAMALLHASTSFPLPDPLTACTGAEQACRILSSGHSQPWMPLLEESSQLLKAIEQLCPRREYYPKELRVMQTVHWNKDLTMEIQNDCYDQLVRSIFEKSRLLEAFHSPEKPRAGASLAVDDGLLRTRGVSRRLVTERSISDHSSAPSKVLTYEPRDREAGSHSGINVYQTAKMLLCDRLRIPKAHLVQTLQRLPGNIIGGFRAAEDRHPSSLDVSINGEIGEQFGTLVNYCRTMDESKIYDAFFRLGLLSFSPKADMNVIRVLCAFSKLEELQALKPPDCLQFTEYQYRAELTQERITELIEASLPESPPRSELSGLTHQKKLSPARQNSQRRKFAESLARHLFEQWPCDVPSTTAFDAGNLDISGVMDKLIPEWTRVANNLKLSGYLDMVETVLRRHVGNVSTEKPTPWYASGTMGSPFHGTVVPSLSHELLLKEGPSAPLVEDLRPSQAATTQSKDNPQECRDSKEMKELGQILEAFATSPNPLWQQYGKDLLQSYAALRECGSQQQSHASVPEEESLNQNIATAQEGVLDCFAIIESALASKDDRHRWLRLGGLWPEVTPVSILQQLRSKDKHIYGPGMKELFVAYGTLITTLQWLLRMRRAYRAKDLPKLLEHSSDQGHTNWNPIQFTDWLLLEIEGNILIRREQVEVAKAIIAPPSSFNSVLQLNMGRGKTSCIVPMVVSVLADSKQLCRLIVPKALLPQTAQTLQSKIGGLLGREMKHIPFSRRTPAGSDMQELYLDLHRSILDSCGVILAIPEHVLSYKLSGFQKLADSKIMESRHMIGNQAWLTRTCRDVLDESDFTLAVKTQLIYPSGQLVPVDGHPDRWKVVQSLLALLQGDLPYVCQKFPHGIELVRRQDCFPMIYIVQVEVEDALQRRLTDAICDGRTACLQLPGSFTDNSRACLRRILSEEHLKDEDFTALSKKLETKPSLFKNILIIRGLLQKRVLFLCLKKRWNVQYGLHPKRDPLAVPFEAKGVPSEQAEFGHPDVAIIFTCLSFYYSGLSIAQFREGLESVLKADDPASEYDGWTSGCQSLPEALSHWNLINADDAGQVEELWKKLRLSRGVLDHYLNTFVFPRYAKQFATKMQSSGWDLPIFSPDLKQPEAKTTGFSGTNDNRRLLPLTIRQDDLPSLKHTSAEVLSYLLLDRNRKCMIAAKQGARLKEKELLAELNNAEIRLLIDAGAYILEMDNRSLVMQWLTIDTAAVAGVYFNSKDNQAWVHYRVGKDVPLLATPFAEDLSECVVYLDEAHTRGTDLKLPRNARGALTLALGQTKDHTVQAAMRLRQLATSQSITFCAPPEVQRSIRGVCGKDQRTKITSYHVVYWLLEQTCRNNELLQSLFNAQGLDFCRRMSAAQRYPDFLSNAYHKSSLLNLIKSPEQINLDELYGCAARDSQQNDPGNFHPSVRGMTKLLGRYRAGISNVSSLARSSLMEEVEQEREVEFQVEEVREVQYPVHYKSLEFPGLHSAIYSFAMTGKLEGNSGYELASVFLQNTDLGRAFNVCAPGCRLLVSAEFKRTIVTRVEGGDNFLRPVEWFLWGFAHETALVIVPEEAELLIPAIRALEDPPVYLIPYSAPTTKNMVQNTKLASYTLPSRLGNIALPPWLSIELGLLGARLYFDFEECSDLLDYLQFKVKVGGDSAAGSASKKVPGSSSAGDIYTFLVEWLTVRRKGQDIMHTPMGYICQGRRLEKTHPFFMATEVKSGEGEDLEEDEDLLDESVKSEPDTSSET